MKNKQERLQEVPTSTPVTSEPNFYAETDNHLGALPGSEFDQSLLPPNAQVFVFFFYFLGIMNFLLLFFFLLSYLLFCLLQGSEFLRGFRSADQNGFTDAWDEIQHQSHGPPFDHFYDRAAAPQLQPTLDGTFFFNVISLLSFTMMRLK